MGWSQDEVGEDDRGAFADVLTSARPWFQRKRPGELSPGRNSSMIKGYVKGGSL